MASRGTSDSEEVQWTTNPASDDIGSTKGLRGESVDSYAEVDMEEDPHMGKQMRKATSCSTTLVVAGAVLLVGAVAAILIVVFTSTRGASTPLSVPKTFSASYIAHGSTHDAANDRGRVTGSLHKSLTSSGKWNISGSAQVYSHGQKTVVTLVNKRVYMEVYRTDTGALRSQGCMTGFDVPYFQVLGASLENTSPMSTGESLPNGVQGCSDASGQWSFRFNDEAFVLCQLNDGSMALHGANVAASVFNVDMTAPEASPHTVPVNMTSGAPMECPVARIPDIHGRRRLGVLSWFRAVPLNFFSSLWTKRSFPPLIAETKFLVDGAVVVAKSAESSSLPPTPTEGTWTDDDGDKVATTAKAPDKLRRRRRLRRFFTQHDPPSSYIPPPLPNKNASPYAPSCVLMHGAGFKQGAVPQEAFEDYWSLTVEEQLLNECVEVKYVPVDTRGRSWDNPTVLSVLCDVLDDAAASAAGVLLISHGTGTMAAAAAFESGLCSLHPMTGFWVDLQSSDPLENLGFFAIDFCAEYTQAPPGSDPIGDALQQDFGLCTSTGADRSWASLTTKFMTPAMASRISSTISGAMCGFRPEGLLGSSYGFLLEDDWVPPAISSDLEDWSPCWNPAFQFDFELDFLYPFYSASINYIDVTGRNGNGFSGVDRHPVRYLETVAHYALVAIEIAATA